MPEAPRRYAPAKGVSREYRPKKPKSAAKRGYDHVWRAFRESWLQATFECWVRDHPDDVLALPNCLPPCAECLRRGFVVEGDQLDHITPHRGDREVFWRDGNYQVLCTRCHGRKTKAGE